MRLLYLSHCVPYPPNKGDKIRAFHELQRLGRGHEIHLLALAKEPGDLKLAAPLREICARVELFRLHRRAAQLRGALGLMGRQPLTVRYFHSRALHQRVRELARSAAFDAVVAYSSAMVPYARQVRGVPRILDLVDVDSEKWAQYGRFTRLPRRALYQLEARRLRAYESSLSDSFRLITVTTPRELELLQAIDPGVAARVVQNGVSLPDSDSPELPRTPAPTLIFTGQMDYLPNVDGVVHFARTVFPRLKRRVPELRLLIVGRSPTAAVRSLTRIDGVEVTGEVADVRPFLGRAWIFVAPLRIAQGIQNKVLEAMAAELPVVCSQPVMAGLSGSGCRAGRDLLVADDDAGLEEAITRLAERADLRRSLGHAGRRRVKGAFSWDAHMSLFESMVVDAALPGRSPSAPREVGHEEVA